jgi:hypothetical protein
LEPFWVADRAFELAFIDGAFRRGAISRAFDFDIVSIANACEGRRRERRSPKNIWRLARLPQAGCAGGFSACPRKTSAFGVKPLGDDINHALSAMIPRFLVLALAKSCWPP